MPRFLIGLPTYCEAGTIAALVRSIDSQLLHFPSGLEFIIANSDNCSPDRTSELFSSAPTSFPKLSLRTQPHQRGKGYNVRNLIEASISHEADGTILLDGDLELLPADWIGAFLSGLSRGSDFVLPLYARHSHDGNLTNNIVVPILFALGSQPVRQPIGGDFALSRRAMLEFLKTDWPRSAYGYGIDIYLLIRAMQESLVIDQQLLSCGKLHSQRSSTAAELEAEMDRKFVEVVGTLFSFASFLGTLPKSDVKLPMSPPLLDPAKPFNPVHLAEAARTAWSVTGRWTETRLLLDNDMEEIPSLDDLSWCSVLARIVRLAQREPLSDALLLSFKSLFLIRIAHTVPALLGKSPDPMVALCSEKLRMILAADILARPFQEAG